jgi:uncharacterized membrane protein
MTHALLALLSLTGLYISAYFTLVYYRVIPPDSRWVPPFCRMEDQTCQLVVQHRDARVFGLPNSVLGVVFYAMILVNVLTGGIPTLTSLLMYGSWLTVALAVYLVHSLYFKVKVVCILCLISHGINLLIALLLTV